MADIKSDLFKKDRVIGETQQKVVFQQKKPLLNYELNLLQDISNEKINDLTKLSIGNNFKGDSFKILANPSANSVVVNKGVFYHNGVPVVLSDDIVFSNLTEATSERTDVIYAEWFIDEVDSSEDPEIKDPAIGFETSRQQRVRATIKCSENSSYPVISSELVTFNSTQRSITLQNGIFPDWLRLSGTKPARFLTSSLNNEMGPSGYFEVESSPAPNVIVLKSGTSLTSEALSHVKFYEFDPTHTAAAQKEFEAYRKNFITLAKISRSVGTSILESDISDERSKVVYNFVKSGCKVTRDSDTTISVGEGEVFVGDVNHYIESGVSFSIGSGLETGLNYIYVNNSGYVESSLVEPTDYHVLLATVRVKGSLLWGKEDSSLSGSTKLNAVDDCREFSPISWNYKYGDEGGTGETGFTTIVLKFKADATISDRSLVYLSSNNIVGIADATNTLIKKIPAIGIVPQAIPENEINNVVILGEIENSSWNFTPGAILYAGSGGSLTMTPPTLRETFVQRVGVAVSKTRAFIKPDSIFIKNSNTSGETALVALNTNGSLEIIGYAAKINSDRSSFLAPVATTETGTYSFDILPGRVYFSDTNNKYFPGLNVNLGIGGNFQTTGIHSGYFNKVFFTLDDSLNVKRYEGLADTSLENVLDPEIPSNEMPICVVSFQAQGELVGGDIYAFGQTSITDKRNWLNLGNLDNSSFSPIYRDGTKFIVQKGEMWVNNYYIKLSNNLEVMATTSLASSKFVIYLDLQSASGGTAQLSDFVTILSTTSVDKRRYLPIGEYYSSSSKIVRSSFKAYSSKFWQFRDKPFSDEQKFPAVGVLSSSTNVFTTTNFFFLDSDFLDITINGVSVFENEDYVKTSPSNITFKYNVKKGSKVKIRKV